jgi:hypothetical protein
MFDTNFNYKNETYTATVVISGKDEGKMIEVKLPETLNALAPDGKIVVETAAGENTDQESVEAKDPVLVESVLAAIEKHEKAKPPLGVGSVWS